MIESIKISNYQSLVDAEIKPGKVTVLLGPNDHGKSAALRALRGLAEAQPGNAFITYGKKQTQVSVIADGHEIKWIKGEKANKYILDGVPFEKVGRSVPPEVEDLLGLATVSFDKDLALSLNFADQDDPPFLIPMPGGLTTSAVAKILGDLTNLNLLFKAVNEADRRRKQAASTAQIRQSDADELTELLKPYETLPKKFEDLVAFEVLLTQAQAMATRRSHLIRLRQEVLDLRAEHQVVSDLRTKVSKIPPREDLYAVEALVMRLNKLKTLKVDLFHLKEQHTALSVSKSDAEARVRMNQKDITELEKEFPTCPTCGQRMHKEQLAVA